MSCKSRSSRFQLAVSKSCHSTIIALTTSSRLHLSFPQSLQQGQLRVQWLHLTVKVLQDYTTMSEPTKKKTSLVAAARNANANASASSSATPAPAPVTLDRATPTLSDPGSVRSTPFSDAPPRPAAGTAGGPAKMKFKPRIPVRRLQT